MAAGMGSRFGSLKQITPLGPHQKALLHYTVYDAVHAGFDKIVFVIRESFAQEFKDFVGKYSESLVETAYCYQSMDKLPGNMPPIILPPSFSPGGSRWETVGIRTHKIRGQSLPACQS